MNLPIAVIILTYNEENNIEDCIKSVLGWAGELLVLDSYSTDRTLEIARKYTDEIYQHPFRNYSLQRNWAQDHLPLKNDWIFHLDSDERVTPALAKQLKERLPHVDQGTSGFLVSRRTVFMGKWVKHGGHYPAYHCRIFRKNLGRCEDRLYDQHFCVNGQIEILKGDIVDTITADLSSWILRHKRWAALEAMEVARLGMKKQEEKGRNQETKRITVKANRKGNPIEQRRWMRAQYYRLPMFIRPFLYFAYRYIVRLGFMDGKEGLIFHFLQGFWYRFLVDVKIYVQRKPAAKKT